MRAIFFSAFVLFFVGLAPVCRAGALPLSTIRIETAHGSREFTVEVADEPRKRAQGLMYRMVLAPDAGMLFDFQDPRYVAFWMKNTHLPLDMIFVRADGTISSIAADTIPYSLTPIRSSEPVRFVIEINAGLSKKLGIHPGDRVHGALFGG